MVYQKEREKKLRFRQEVKALIELDSFPRVIKKVVK
jgi:hypothetical protein